MTNPLGTNPATRRDLELRGHESATLTPRVGRHRGLRCPTDRDPDAVLPGQRRRDDSAVGKGLHVKGSQDPLPATPLSAGSPPACAATKPGNGPRLHGHDPSGTSMAVRRAGRVAWRPDAGDLGPLGVCSATPCVPRAFSCLNTAVGEDEGSLVLAAAGDAPGSTLI